MTKCIKGVARLAISVYDTELDDATVVAQKILSCVYRLEQKFGVKHLVDVLRGSKTKMVMEKRHEELSTFNLMPECSEADLRYYIDALIEKGFLERTEGDYPVLRWTESSRDAAQGKIKVMTRKKRAGLWKERKKSQDLECDMPLFTELSKLRSQLAHTLRVPAFVIFSDRTLIEMSQTYPRSRDDFLNINGVSTTKWNKYGSAMLQVISDYCAKNHITVTAPPPPAKKAKSLSTESSEETVRLFESGQSIDEIAAQRKLTSYTVLDHLSKQIMLGKKIDISSLVSSEKRDEIEKAIAIHGAEKLGPLKNELPESFTYEEIKLAASFHRRKN